MQASSGPTPLLRLHTLANRDSEKIRRCRQWQIWTNIFRRARVRGQSHITHASTELPANDMLIPLQMKSSTAIETLFPDALRDPILRKVQFSTTPRVDDLGLFPLHEKHLNPLIAASQFRLRRVQA